MPTRPPYNPNASPKARFTEVESHVREHKALVESDEFIRGADTALLQAQQMWSDQVKDGNTAMVAGVKLQGALEFLTQFKLLAESAPRLAVVPQNNLSGAIRQ